MSGNVLVGDADEWTGGSVTPLTSCVLAPNPSAWTLDGTNTWIVGAVGGPCVVVDPGPLGDGHESAILTRIEERSAQVTAVLLTHGHIDHSEGADDLARRLGVDVRSWRAGNLVDTDRIEVNGGELRVMATPGHSSDSVCFLVDDLVLTGDTVLGRGTSVVAHPDGRLAEYLASLQSLSEWCSQARVQRLLPGHGPVIEDPQRVVDYYLAHRQDRLVQVKAAMEGGATTAEEIVDIVYADVPHAVRAAAEATVLAQLAYLESEN